MEYHNTTQQISSDTQYSSSVGSVVNVATPATRKLRALGVVWSLITLFPIVVINYLVFDALSSDESLLRSGNVVHLLGSALMPFMAWFALGSALQRFHAASINERYLRAGPGGVSICLPDDTGSATFRFSLRTVSFDLPWDQIKTWYPYVQSMNGIPTERSIVFETLKGEKVKLKTYHFAEKQKEIAARINQARSLAVEQTSVNVANQQDTAETTLPPGIGELSVQIKKKKDRVKEIDLRTIPHGQRAACIERIADVLETKLGSLCPTTAGYKYSRKHYRPFQEWKNVFGIRLYVQHGLLRGYEIQVEPKDSECRMLTISMCPSSLIADIRKYVSIGMGIVFLLISFKWLPLIRYWLGEFSQLTPLVMLVIAVAALALTTGLLQIPIGLLRILVSDKQREEVQKQQIKLGLQEVAIADL